jgi:uncharacterized damage-inducible protein DinB
MPDVRYPIGAFADSKDRSPERRLELIRQIQNLPAELRAACAGLGDAQLDLPYREGGWTVRQVIHHLADASLHGYTRMKFGALEDSPTILPYDENAWVTTADAHGPIEPSLALLQALHMRWAMFLRALTPADFDRVFQHPACGATPLAAALELYAWHGRHHVAHVLGARGR